MAPYTEDDNANRRCLQAVVAAALQHVDEALDIRVDIGVRVFQRIVNARLGCQMNDDRKTMLLEKHFDCRAIGQIELHEGEVGIALQNLSRASFGWDRNSC